MVENSILKAEILSQALPYIQKYNNKIVVIKYGGNAMINEELKMNVITDVVLLSEIGVKVILVHGGGPEINQTLKKIGKETKFINGLRYTDEETIDIVQMVLAGKTNKDLVKLIMQKGGNATGISGIDNMLIEAEKYESDLDDIITYIVKKLEKEYQLYQDKVSQLKEMIHFSNLHLLTLEQKEKTIIELMCLLKCDSQVANFKFLSDKYRSYHLFTLNVTIQI